MLRKIVMMSVLFMACPVLGVEPSVDLLRRLDIRGLDAKSTEPLKSRLPLKPESPFTPEQIRISMKILRSTFQDKGHYSVQITSESVPVGAHHQDVVFTVHPGPVYHIGTIRIEGNRRISDRIILRDLNIHTGDTFSQARIFEGHRELYRAGYFRSIDLHYSTAPAQGVDVAIRVRERATRYLKGGMGYGTQTKESVSLGYEDLNFLGNARKLDVSATHSGFLTHPSHYRTTLLQTNLLQPHLFDSPYEGQMNVFREYDDREAYDSIATATRISVGRHYSSDITAYIRYRYQGTRVTRVSPEAQTPGFSNVSAAGPSFTYDNTNDPFLPTVGWRILGAYEEGFRFFAGDVRFHKLETRIGRFDRLFGGWVGFAGLQGGEMVPDSTSSHDVIPIYERYFLGGAESVRGYSERELGPRDTQGVPLGGNAFLVGNLEIRHSLYKKLWGVLFLDGGQLYPTEPGDRWPHVQMKSLRDFRYGTGIGFRYHSPVGAIRLEFGYQLNPETGTGFLDRTAIHFSIGEVF